ncbi:MAG: tetratricopeptide repeat protein [Acidobacteria bacterium]|nr:tetratricopeptide repeat protein [Acidobacteriota bacterium]
MEVGSWPVRNLNNILYLVGNIRKGKLQPYLSDRVLRLFKGRRYINKNILPFLYLPDDPNQLLKRAAFLHTDIAMFQLDTGVSGFDQSVIAVQDGMGTVHGKGWHWIFARNLLSNINPHPSDHEIVRKWYIATTAFMLSSRHFGDAEDNLAPALEYFSSDPHLLFYKGVLHEKYAMPSYQNTVLTNGMPFNSDSEKSELKNAREYFQKALKADPNFSEARLHLGRVKGLLGDHEEAVEELRSSATSITDKQLRYYCSLYLGNELAVLNRITEARRQFETAAELYPNAQAPLLSLSRLALDRGDYESALAHGKEIFTLPVKEEISEDPWWSYDVSPALNASALISEMYQASGELPAETIK